MIYVAIIALVIYTLLTAGKLVLDVALKQAQIQQLSDIQRAIAGAGDTLRYVLQQLGAVVPPYGSPNVQAPQALPERVWSEPKAVQVPNDVLDYIGAESEEWAQDARSNRALELYAEHSDWTVVLQQLRREDGEMPE